MFAVLLLPLLITALAGPAWALASLDVGEVYIVQYKDYWDGVVETNPFGIEIWVTGQLITSVSVQDPHGGNHALTNEGGEWRFEGPNFASLASLDAAYGNGNYTFNFNSGEDTVTIDYQYTQPTSFANITYPADGQTGVPLNPTYTWGSVAGYGDAMGMWVLNAVTDSDEYWDAPQYNMAMTSWQPGPLDESTAYEFEISVFKAQGGAPQALTTDGADGFTYYGLFDYLNIVGFTTIPEPATAFSLLAMIGLYFICRRSQ